MEKCQSSDCLFESVKGLICDKLKINRDKGVACLKEYCQIWVRENNWAQVDLVKEFIRSSLTSSTDWVCRNGAMEAFICLLENIHGKMPLKSCQIAAWEEFVTFSATKCVELLSDDEVRNRTSAGVALAEVCRVRGSSFYADHLAATLLHLIRSHMERVVEVETEFHDTAGWKCLETSMKCLETVMKALGDGFWGFLTTDLLGLLYTSLKHSNRFVRETGFNIMGTISDICSPQLLVENIAQNLVPCLGDGMSDNWSQVRLAASISNRKFLQKLDENQRRVYYGVLIPRMCLNRYYVAEGVRIYCQESWKMFMQDRGRTMIAEYINETVAYYSSQAEADNHAVREAACACI
eukprot:Sdes_comp16053_c0_seq1m5258